MAWVARIAAIALGLAVFASQAFGQLLHRATDPVATPASSIVLADDALSLDNNVAALAMLKEPSFAFLHAEVDQRDSFLGRGDALYAAVPLFGRLTLAGTLQSIRPGSRAAGAEGEQAADRAMAAFGLALAPSSILGLGVTTRTFSSGDGQFDGLTAVDAGLLLRPSAWLSFSVVGRDLFVSREGFGTGGLDLGSSVLFGASLRPFARDMLTLDASLVVDAGGGDRLAGRAGVSVAVPYIGTASGLVEVEQLGDDGAALRLVAELAVQYSGLSAIAGGTGGDGFDGRLGGYGMLRYDGQPRRGISPPSRVLDIEVAGIGSRSMIALSLMLARARRDRDIGGVLLRMHGSELGLAYAQELRMLIAGLRASGKPVVCHLDSASGAAYYGCAGADEILIDPAGDIRLMGLSSEILLFGGTLRKIGVRADFIRIGDYKSAPEQYTHSEMSEAARAQARGLLDAAHGRMLADLSANLGVSQERVADLIDGGPYLASSAVSVGLASGVADSFDLRDADLAAFGGRSRIQRFPPDPDREWGSQPTVGVVVIDDEIVDGDSVDVPILDIHMSGARTIARELDAMASDSSVRAIVLRVDSPGGAVLASDQIWRAIRRAREKKPVIASLGAVAASGGYYAACAADEIWADPSTMTGSIGIFYGKVDVSGLADKLGVGIEIFKRGKRAGAQSLFRPFTGDERRALAESLRQYYERFLSRVAEGRGMSMGEVDRLGRGRVYSGDQALANGLVDRLGGLSSALSRARRLGGVAEDAEVLVRPERGGGLVRMLTGGLGALGSDDDDAIGAQAAISVPEAARPMLRALIALAHMGHGQPMARLPFVYGGERSAP